MNELAFWVCMPAGVVALAWVVARARGPQGLPFLVYSGFYVLSTVVGATIVRLDPSLTEALLIGRGYDIRGIPAVDGWLYWGLLYLPLVVAAAALTWARPNPTKTEVTAAKASAAPAAATSLASFLIVLIGLVGYCLVEMITRGYSPMPSSLAEVAGSYLRTIVRRYDMMADLGPAYFGVVYMGLPTLTYVGLYAAARTRRLGWIIAAAVTATATMWLSVVSAQKSILIVFLIFLGLGTFLLGLVRFRVLVILSGALFVLVYLMQAFVLGAFGATQTFLLVLFRLGPSFPYYLGLFPRIYPYYGVDWQGTLFGHQFTGSAPDYNVLVASALEPTAPLQGAAPAGAIPSAYAEGGVAYALVMALIVMLILGAISRFGRHASRSAYRFAFYLQLLTASYYLTQVPLAATIWHGYGIRWGIQTLLFLWLLDYGLFRLPAPAHLRLGSRVSAQTGTSNG